MNKTLNYFSAIKYLSKYTKKYRKNFFAFSVGWGLDMLINIILPIMIGIFVDEIVYYQNITSFLNISLMILMLLIFLCTLYFFVYAQQQYLMSKFTYDIRMDLYRHWQMIDCKFINEIAIGEIINSLQLYSVECLHFVVRNVIHFFNGLIKLLILVVLLMLIDWKVGIFILIAAPFSVYASVVLGKRSSAYASEHKQALNTYTGWLYEILDALKYIRMCGVQETIKEELRKRNGSVYNYKVKSELSQIVSNNIINLINLIVKLVIFAFIGMMAIKDNITIGTLLIMMSYYAILSEQIAWTSSSYVDARRRIIYVQSIKNLLEKTTEDHDNKNVFNINEGSINIENVFFSYNDSATVLSNFSLKIEPNKKTAIVGNSGCGKSTLAYLILAFYKPNEGNIIIDNTNINEVSIKSLRSNIGYISQDNIIFNATIKENILMGNPKATNEDIINACIKADIWEYIQSLPEKLDTIMEVGGKNLSRGQQQRIAIARIYVKNPKIIIFDEATSSLDKITEESVYSLWQDVLENKTSIIITHKLTTVLETDYTCVIKSGEVVSYGKTKDIVKNDHNFHDLFFTKN